jgi:hypothetical protein
VAFINYSVDPSQLFGNGQIEKHMADIMLEGKNVSNVVNFDHRLLQKYYFEGSLAQKDVVVFGSSRGMLLSNKMFPAKSFYNASIAGTSIEDYLGVYQLMVDQNVLPKTLILEISPWVFNPNNEQTRWKSLGREYLEALTRLSLPQDLSTWASSLDLQKYGALLSLAYLQESVRWLSIPADFYATESENTGEAMKLSDGSREYDAKSEALSPDDVRAIVLDSLNEPYSLTDFHELDPQISKVFERFIASVQSDGIRIIILLVPYQPDYYQTLVSNPKYEIIREVEKYLKGFATSHGIAVWGSYDPSVIGCNVAEYYDGLHPRTSCMLKLISEYYERSSP